MVVERSCEGPLDICYVGGDVMNLEKLNPWNWFKHEQAESRAQVPVKQSEQARPVSGHVSPFDEVQQTFDRLFDTALSRFGLGNPTGGEVAGPDWRAGVFRPSVNVSGDGKHYEVSVETPGMTDKDIHLELNKDVLTIRGEKREETESKDKSYYRMERRYGRFQRTLSLPEDCDPDNIEASLKDGLLTITIGRRELPKGEVKRIVINS